MSDTNIDYDGIVEVAEKKFDFKLFRYSIMHVAVAFVICKYAADWMRLLYSADTFEAMFALFVAFFVFANMLAVILWKEFRN